ncbi:MAG TPA: tRNA (adenosine(37)-N6)-threonylcarbamoyltransferase complex transferase subunit TsaD, partial [Clostridiales bacterium]|nr:tRNA (adenosine(37)-N6)-threonylcarbamoyltransferase complex transferase subunit TsaD [Clostridiales bacterium]
MKILALETSCDETAAAVVENGRRVMSNVIASQVAKHMVYGGVVPEIASRCHVEAVCEVTQEALKRAELTFSDLDALAVTYTPGLIGALLVGVNYAKGLSLSIGLPLIPVHHLRSHIAACYITHKNLEPPFLALVVSGGHSHIVGVDSYTDFKVLGRTRDDAAGEVMDQAARALGLYYPGGLNLDIQSKRGDAGAYSFPRPRVEDSELDFSFSGLKTFVVNLIHNASERGERIDTADLGASFINAVTDCLVENTFLAASLTGQKRIVLAGGVSANSVLRKKMQLRSEEMGYEIYMPELSLCGDNAAMVAAQAYYEFISGNVADLS